MRAAWYAVILGAPLVAWCFGGIGCGGMFAVRDAAHYYHPLLQYTRAEWRAGRIPLWNPYQDLGIPLAAGGTAGAFYPPALVWVLAPSFEAGYAVYVVGHVVLAMLSAGWLARHWNATGQAAAVAAVSYAFSGSVLFQYANVVYLVGAAWLPLAILAGERLLEGQRRACVELAAVLALLVLGGDPQAAYHAVLWIAARILWFDDVSRAPWASGPAGGDRLPETPPVRFAQTCDPGEGKGGGAPWRRLRRLAWLAAALGMAAGLAAIQALPALEFFRHSQRAQGPLGSVWELPAAMRHGQMREWIDAVSGVGIRPGSHRQHMYHYSLGPWRGVELLWPNCGGRAFAQHRRWFQVLPAEGPLWVPSLYMGLLPLVLALTAMRFGGRQPRQRWLSWMTVLFAAGSLGWHGVGWVANELRLALGGQAGQPWSVAPPFGGVYWAMTVLLPGYTAFRYPAKLFTVATLGLAMLAAAGWDRALGPGRAGLRRWMVRLAVLSALGVVAAILAKPLWAGWWAAVPESPWFGPFDAEGAFGDLVGALVHTAAVAGMAASLLALPATSPWVRRTPTLLAILVAVDIGVANGWMVATAPASLWRSQSALAEGMEHDAQRRGRPGPVRVFRRPAWAPQPWKLTRSTTRLAETVLWNRNTLHPLHHLAVPVALAQVPDAMHLADYRMLLAAARLLPGQQRPALLPRQEVLDALGAAYLVLAGSEVPDDGERVWLAEGDNGTTDVSLWYNADALPRVWLVHRLTVLEPLRAPTPRAMLRRTQQVLEEAGRPGGLRKHAVVEAEPEQLAGLPARGAIGTGAGAHRLAPGAGTGPAEECRIVRYEPSQVEIEAQLHRPGLVVLADQFYPGWRLEVSTNGGAPRPWPILRTNRVMRGAWLPAGRHRLVYRYRPSTFLGGAIVSGVAWAAVIAWAVGQASRRRDRRPGAWRRRVFEQPKAAGQAPEPAAARSGSGQ